MVHIENIMKYLNFPAGIEYSSILLALSSEILKDASSPPLSPRGNCGIVDNGKERIAQPVACSVQLNRSQTELMLLDFLQLQLQGLNLK